MLQLHLSAMMSELNPSQLACLYWSFARLNTAPVTELQWRMEDHIRKTGKRITPRNFLKMITVVHKTRSFEDETRKALDWTMASVAKDLNTQVSRKNLQDVERRSALIGPVETESLF